MLPARRGKHAKIEHYPKLEGVADSDNVPFCGAKLGQGWRAWYNLKRPNCKRCLKLLAKRDEAKET